MDIEEPTKSIYCAFKVGFIEVFDITDFLQSTIESFSSLQKCPQKENCARRIIFCLFSWCTQQEKVDLYTSTCK